jgi:hypothetical protein
VALPRPAGINRTNPAAQAVITLIIRRDHLNPGLVPAGQSDWP